MADIVRPDWRAWLRRFSPFPPEVTDPAARTELERLATAVEGGLSISRRGFLGAMLGTVAIAATVDVEALIWTPGERASVIVSPYEVWPDWVTCEVLRIFNNNLRVANLVNRTYDDDFAVGTIRVIDRRRVA